jgi:hypothetical protein
MAEPTAMMDRRHLLRIAGPAIALPVAASLPVEAKETRLVTREEIMQAFRFYDGMELQAEDLNLRYQVLIDMLFETNPENLRAKLQQLIDNRKDRCVLVDGYTAETAPYHPDMYDELGHRKRVEVAQQQLKESVTGPHIKAKAASIKRRIARAMRKRVIGV